MTTPNKRKLIERGWAISGIFFNNERFIYTGWWLSRSAAIRSHCNDKFVIPGPIAKTVQEAWSVCKAKGDRAIRVKVELEAPNASKP